MTLPCSETFYHWTDQLEVEILQLQHWHHQHQTSEELSRNDFSLLGLREDNCPGEFFQFYFNWRLKQFLQLPVYGVNVLESWWKWVWDTQCWPGSVAAPRCSGWEAGDAGHSAVSKHPGPQSDSDHWTVYISQTRHGTNILTWRRFPYFTPTLNDSW